MIRQYEYRIVKEYSNYQARYFPEECTVWCGFKFRWRRWGNSLDLDAWYDTEEKARQFIEEYKGWRDRSSEVIEV